MPFDEALYQKLLGQELRALRHRRGWTRDELRHHLHRDKSIPTLATYEQGTRHFTVVCLADMCAEMNDHPHGLLARVHNRMTTNRPGHIVIDLATVSTTTHPDLHPLRAWARGQLLAQTSGSPPPHTLPIDTPTLEAMALLCGMSCTELVSHLHHGNT